MDNIVIVDALSSGEKYIQDIIENGYKPVVLFSYVPKNAYEIIFSEREDCEKKYKNVAKFYHATNDYIKTLDLVRGLSPKLILPGCEDGVELAYRLCKDLNLPSNDYNKIKNFTDKFTMHKVLEQANIRSIPSAIVYKFSDLENFIDQFNIQSFILKPSRGAGGVGFFECNDISLAKNIYEKALKEDNFYGLEDKPLIAQKKINGKEYVVNTMSYKDDVVLTSMWKYSNPRSESSTNLYDKCFLSIENSEYQNLYSYASKVVKALGIEYGPVHGEYMIDEHGPVLIEVNCRPMGASFPKEFSDVLLGHHETDIVLKSYLEEKIPSFKLNDGKYAGIIFIVSSPYNKSFFSVPIKEIIKYLPGKWKLDLSSVKDNKIHVTTNLENSPCLIKGLIEKDKKDTIYEYLKDLQNNYFYLIFDTENNDDKASSEKFLNAFFDSCNKHDFISKNHIPDNFNDKTIIKLLDIFRL